MAKQKFTVAHDIRMDGRHLKAGSSISLDPEDPKDAATLANLLSSNRLGDVPPPEVKAPAAPEAPAETEPKKSKKES